LRLAVQRTKHPAIASGRSRGEGREREGKERENLLHQKMKASLRSSSETPTTSLLLRAKLLELRPNTSTLSFLPVSIGRGNGFVSSCCEHKGGFDENVGVCERANDGGGVSALSFSPFLRVPFHPFLSPDQALLLPLLAAMNVHSKPKRSKWKRE